MARSTLHANHAERGRIRVRVNPLRCVAFGYCAEFCPEVFDLDDWGYAWPRKGDADRDLLAVLQQAADLCPTEAISVEIIEPQPEHAVRGRQTRRTA